MKRLFSPIDEMREWIGEKSPVHAKHMSDTEILSWFSNHIALYDGHPKYYGDKRVKRALNIWMDYCLLQDSTIVR